MHHLKSAAPRDDVFELDGARLAYVKLVGRITRIDDGGLTWTFRLSDDTGQVVVRKQVVVDKCIADVAERIVREEVEDLPLPPLPPVPWKDGTYVRVLATVHTLDVLDVVHIHPIADFNEVTCHALQCILEHCKLSE